MDIQTEEEWDNFTSDFFSFISENILLIICIIISAILVFLFLIYGDEYIPAFKRWKRKRSLEIRLQNLKVMKSNDTHSAVSNINKYVDEVFESQIKETERLLKELKQKKL